MQQVQCTRVSVDEFLIALQFVGPSSVLCYLQVFMSIPLLTFHACASVREKSTGFSWLRMIDWNEFYARIINKRSKIIPKKINHSSSFLMNIIDTFQAVQNKLPYDNINKIITVVAADSV